MIVTKQRKKRKEKQGFRNRKKNILMEIHLKTIKLKNA